MTPYRSEIPLSARKTRSSSSRREPPRSHRRAERELHQVPELDSPRRALGGEGQLDHPGAELEPAEGRFDGRASWWSTQRSRECSEAAATVHVSGVMVVQVLAVDALVAVIADEWTLDAGLLVASCGRPSSKSSASSSSLATCSH